MKLVFQNVIPSFLGGATALQSDVWGREFSFDNDDKIIVSAQSGKGKSTLLAYLFGIRNAYSGNILINDKDIRLLTLREWNELRKIKISLLLQELRLFDELTVRQNLDIKLRLSATTGITEALRMLGHLEVDKYIDTPCKHLSFGQRQRVAIVRSLLQPFDWLLMDEPFSHLDEKNAALCLQLINDAAEQNNAGIIITSLGANLFPPQSFFNRTLNL